MERLDATIAAVGTAVLLVAIAGSYLYAGSDTVGEYVLSYPTGQVDVATASGAMPAPGTPTGGTTRAEVPVEVMVSNLTGLTFRVTVVPPTPAPAGVEYRVTVAGPDGASREAKEAGGAYEAIIPLRDPPGDRRVQAESREAAYAFAAEDASWEGLGNWTVVVEATTTGPAVGDFRVEVGVTGEAYRAEPRAPGEPPAP